MANWQQFITEFSNFLSSNQSSGPFQTGKKLSEYYVDAIKGAKAIPSGNRLNGNLAQSFKPILDLGFGLGFFLLQNSNKTFEQLQEDKSYFNGSSPLPSEEDQKSFKEEPQVQDQSIDDIFNLVTQDDLEDIRKNGTWDFFLHETDDKESTKIFNFKTKVDFNNVGNTKVSIFGNTLQKAKNGIAKYGFLPGINTILTFNRQDPKEDAQDEINSRGIGALTFNDLFNYFIKTLNDDRNNRVYENLSTLEGDLEGTINDLLGEQFRDIDPVLNDSPRLDKAVRANTGSDSGTQAVRNDIDNIFLSLYTAELQKWIEIITPYISKGLAKSSDETFSDSAKTTPSSLGISADGKNFVSIIEENSVFPTVSSRSVTTIGDFQKEAQFKIAIKSGSNVSILQDVTLSNIQYGPAGTPIIDIRFTLNGTEDLSVVITDLSTRSQERFTINKVFGQNGYPPKSQDETYRFPAGGPIYPSTAVQEQEAVKSAKDSLAGVLGSLSSDFQQKLINFGLDAKIADLMANKDPYLVMSSSVVLYWTILGLVPICFAANPPVLPASIPVPGLFTIIFPGLPFKLANGLRLAFNAGLNPIFIPELDPNGLVEKAASISNSRGSEEFKALLSLIELQKKLLEVTKDQKLIPKAVSVRLAISFALHLLSLKFLYTGSTQAGPATVPTPGFVLLVF